MRLSTTARVSALAGLFVLSACCTRRGRDPVERLDVSIAAPAPTRNATPPPASTAMNRGTHGIDKSAHAGGLLALADSKAGAPFSAPVDAVTTLGIHFPNAWTVDDIYVGSFTVRTSDGNQNSLVIAPRAGSDAVALAHTTLSAAGTAVVGLCIGPKALREQSNAWELVTHCSKLVLEVGGKTKPGVETSRFGQPLEVVPLTPTGRTPLGESLAVLFYYGPGEAKESDVEALRPDGTIDRQVTNNSGAANFVLSQPGRWRVSFAKREADTLRMGELLFYVPRG